MNLYLYVFTVNPKRMSFQINVSDHILLEDLYIIVVHKPSGLMVEPDRNGYPNLLHQVRNYLKTSTGAREVYAQHIHRLDRPVSGIVLFAKQRTVLKNLSEQFAERKVQKYYQALTVCMPQQQEGTLIGWHKKEKKKGIIKDEKFAEAESVKLNYSIQPLAGGNFLWDIELHTGKYHQIRAQLSYANCPILGDSLYGSTITYRPDSIALHAAKLIFDHPITHERIMIEKANEF